MAAPIQQLGLVAQLHVQRVTALGLQPPKTLFGFLCAHLRPVIPTPYRPSRTSSSASEIRPSTC